MIAYKIKKIEKIVDGDTIDVTFDLGFDIYIKQRVRLIGIDTPESRTSCDIEKKYGELSKVKLGKWCTEYEDAEIRCESKKYKGKFGRVLGELWIKKDNTWTNVNDWMCVFNYAVKYSGQDKELVHDAHMENRNKLHERGEIILDTF